MPNCKPVRPYPEECHEHSAIFDMTPRCRPPVCIVAMAALCVIAAGAVGARAVEVQDAREIPAMEQPLPNLPGNSLTAVVVQLAPGARVPSHHHAGFVFAYALSGTVRSQLNDGTDR